ncbi:hypothetical protein GDO78_012437 [Eleutherodactylus coqui]|uniref:Uncharacterized protein n=1 Tax=Eleutherodactylus coqui TaxID=57060 RepID=A0A8J6K3X8_ELECQ|nr:hypothetical protein GDO78_012437 [Eleutherodactylus coqui]
MSPKIREAQNRSGKTRAYLSPVIFGVWGPVILVPWCWQLASSDIGCRVSYLSSKKFSRHAIARMISRAPYLLNFSVERLDNRLGFFQTQLGLSGEKVFELEFGFHKNEIQQIALKVPKMLAGSKKKLTEVFDYVHNTMGIPHNLITNFPQVFNTSLLKLKERHEFLTLLGRAIYDPTQPNYVSLDKLVSKTDQSFCEDVAKTSMQDFEQFLKNM